MGEALKSSKQRARTKREPYLAIRSGKFAFAMASHLVFAMNAMWEPPDTEVAAA